MSNSVLCDTLLQTVERLNGRRRKKKEGERRKGEGEPEVRPFLFHRFHTLTVFSQVREKKAKGVKKKKGKKKRGRKGGKYIRFHFVFLEISVSHTA